MSTEIDGFNQAYFYLHKTTQRLRGRAAEYQCVRCERQAAHWAMVHDPVGGGADPWGDYMPMCISCHHAYDKTHERAGMHGKRHSKETKAKLSAAGKGRSWLRDATPEQRAEFGKRISEARKRMKTGEPKPDVPRRDKRILT